MDISHIAILILTVLDAGIIVLAFQFDRRMYKPSVFLRLTTANSTLFLNTEFDEPINRVLLSRGGKLVMVICYLTAVLIELAR